MNTERQPTWNSQQREMNDHIERVNRETFSSRVEDIRRDSSNIYVQLFELIENALEWGGADNLTIKVRENSIIITDNGPNGFGSLEALCRYFKLGERNSKFTENTIGKFGKGGYKACITLSSKLVIKTTIDGVRYKVTADFNTMIDNNSWETSPIEPIEEDVMGTSIELTTRNVYEGQIALKQFRRNIIRTYYKIFIGKTIYLDLPNGNQDTIIIGEDKPIQTSDIREKTINKIVYNKRNQEYKTVDIHSYELEKDDIEVGTIESIVLKRLLRGMEYLGDKPGIDIFRNGRCLTIENPIDHIRNKDGVDVKSRLGGGMMRGAKCYIILNYSDKKLNDTSKRVDDDMAASTQKEFTCSDKMNPSLVELILNTSEECNKRYEELTGKDKTEIIKYATLIKGKINNLDNLSIDDKVNFKNELVELKDGIEKFKDFKSFHKDGDKFKFCMSNSETARDGMIKTRKNSNVYIAFTEDKFVNKIQDTLAKLRKELLDNIVTKNPSCGIQLKIKAKMIRKKHAAERVAKEKREEAERVAIEAERVAREEREVVERVAREEREAVERVAKEKREEAERIASCASEVETEETTSAAVEETKEETVEAAVEETKEETVEAVAVTEEETVEETKEETVEAAVEETKEETVEAVAVTEEETVEETKEETVAVTEEETLEETIAAAVEETKEETVEETVAAAEETKEETVKQIPRPNPEQVSKIEEAKAEVAALERQLKESKDRLAALEAPFKKSR